MKTQTLTWKRIPIPLRIAALLVAALLLVSCRRPAFLDDKLPDDKLWPLNPRILKLLGKASGSLRHDLIVMLLKREEPRWAKLLGDALKETRGNGWQRRSITLLGQALHPIEPGAL